MTDAGSLKLVERVLSAPTKAKAQALREHVGADYLGIFDALLNRLNWKRTLDQNALYHQWLTEIAKHIGETKEETERRCKLSHGCRILCRDSEKFLTFCQKTLKRLPYEEMLEAMDYLNVSSIMTTSQMAEYMDEIERTYRGKGVRLTMPEAA